MFNEFYCLPKHERAIRNPFESLPPKKRWKREKKRKWVAVEGASV
jgi:hypothetical protein